jgi:hypothetical protein
MNTAGLNVRARERGRGVGLIAVGVAALLLLSGCVGLAGPDNVADLNTTHLSGFWAGLWQGLVLPISFIISLFTDKVSIYDVHNNGNWYDFGFVLGALVLPGGFGGSGRRRRRRART